LNNDALIAEEDMTWGEWVNSKYNNTSWGIKNEFIYNSIENYTITKSIDDYNFIKINEIIIPNHHYQIYALGPEKI
jgi:hypothetical protein